MGNPRLVLIIVGFYVTVFCLIGLVKLSGADTEGIDTNGGFTLPVQIPTIHLGTETSSIFSVPAMLINLIIGLLNFIIGLITVLIVGVGFSLTGFGAGSVGYFLTMILFTPLSIAFIVAVFR